MWCPRRRSISQRGKLAQPILFVALRPNSSSDRLVEGILFGSGRHIFLVPHKRNERHNFEHVLVAWNGSRESARGLAEAMPYLYGARVVTVIVVDELLPVEDQAVLGADVVDHLKYHGIEARLRHVKSRDGGTAATLIAEAKRGKADLIVMGGYGHSRLREWLLGGVTQALLHNAPVHLVVAH